jgi:predicted nucleic acid-binding protein
VIVVDASVVLELLLRTSGAAALERRILAPDENLYAPHLLDLEVAQVVRRYFLRGDLTGNRGAEALRDLADLPVERFPHTLFLPRFWELRDNLTCYDASYVALAEALGCTLVTRDRRLARSPVHTASVEVV